MIFVRDEKKQTTVYEGPDADLVPSLMHELGESDYAIGGSVNRRSIGN